MDTASQSEETKAEMDDLSSKIPPWARGDHLRSVEKEVLIPKIMRERSREKCHDLVQGICGIITSVLINMPKYLLEQDRILPPKPVEDCNQTVESSFRTAPYFIMHAVQCR